MKSPESCEGCQTVCLAEQYNKIAFKVRSGSDGKRLADDGLRDIQTDVFIEIQNTLRQFQEVGLMSGSCRLVVKS